jgi:hypothetical protein
MFKDFKKSMVQEFEIIDIHWSNDIFFWIRSDTKKKGIFVSQSGYAKDILEKLKMKICNRYQI